MSSSNVRSFRTSKANKSFAKTRHRLPIVRVSERRDEVIFECKTGDCYSSEEFVDSPTFLYYDCTWFLRLYPNFKVENWMSEHEECMSLYLHRAYSKSRVKINIDFTFGIKKPDGALEETATKNATFGPDFLVFGRKDFLHRHNLDATFGPDFLVFGRKGFLHRHNMESSSILSEIDDTLIITCRMNEKMLPSSQSFVPLLHTANKTVPVSDATQFPSVEQAASPRMKLTELETLSADFGDLFNSKANHDVTIKAKDKKFQAHRTVLAARSHVFAAMFEHELSEKETGVVDVEDSDPESFGDFLQYLYTGKILEISFRNAYHLYVTSDKYDVKELKSFCVTYMMRNLNVENFCDVVTMADQFDEAPLVDSAQVFFNKNVRKILSITEWEKLLQKNHRLANGFLKEMISTVTPQD